MRHRHGLALWLCLGAGTAAAQLTDSLALTPLVWQVEDAVLAGDLPADLDWSDVVQPWQQYLRSPLNLNAATLAELAQLPGLGLTGAQAILTHIAQTGPLQSVLELQAVPGLGPTLVAQLRPFVYVPGDPVPGMGGLALPGTWQVGAITSTGRTFPASRGYTEEQFAGGPWSSFGRIRLRRGRQDQAGLTWLNQPGEPWQWAPAAGWFGPDEVSAHVVLRDRRALRKLALGDYLVHWGQGLLLSTGPAWGRGANPALGAQRVPNELRAAVGTNPALRLRGAAAELRFAPDWSLQVLLSQQARNATLSRDSLASLRTSTLHRTAAERATRHQATEHLLGTRLHYHRPHLDLGVSYVQQRIDWQLAQPDTTQHWLQADFSLRRANWSAFGEVVQAGAQPQSSWLAGIQAIVAPELVLALVGRRFPVDGTAPRAYALAQDPDGVRNEQGLYLAWEYTVRRRWQLHGWLDVYRNPAPDGRRSTPATGTEWLLQTAWQPSRTTTLLLRLRQDQGQRDLASELAPGPVATTTAFRRIRLRAEASWQAHATTWHSRLELSQYHHDGRPAQTGWLVLQDARWRPLPRLHLTARVAWFAISGSDARIYALEPDLPGRWSVPAYSGQGLRLVLQSSYDLTPDWRLWLRVGHTRRSDVPTLGSGVDELPGSHRTDLSLMLAWQWE